MSIVSEITRLTAAKSAIKDAIIAKGVPVGDDVKLDGYADKVAAIQTGGSEIDKYWTWPDGWPNLDKMLEEDTEQYSGKLFGLYSRAGNFAIPFPFEKVIMSDGTVYFNTKASTVHTWEDGYSGHRYFKAYTNSNSVKWNCGANNYLAVVGSGDLIWYGDWNNVFYNDKQLLYANFGMDDEHEFGFITTSAVAVINRNGGPVKFRDSSVFNNNTRLRCMPECATSFTSQYFLASMSSLVKISDYIDNRGTTNLSRFNNLPLLEALPTRVCSNYSVSFANSYIVSKDSVATFSRNGDDLVCDGGFVGNLRSYSGGYVDVCPNDGQTVTLNYMIRNKFTNEEQVAIEECLTRKNWGLVW